MQCHKEPDEVTLLKLGQKKPLGSRLTKFDFARRNGKRNGNIT